MLFLALSSRFWDKVCQSRVLHLIEIHVEEDRVVRNKTYTQTKGKKKKKKKKVSDALSRLLSLSQETTKQIITIIKKS